MSGAMESQEESLQSVLGQIEQLLVKLLADCERSTKAELLRHDTGLLRHETPLLLRNSISVTMRGIYIPKDTLLKNGN